MNKYELFALGHYLSSYPIEWTYKKIIDELRSENPNDEINPFCMYENILPRNLATFIESMISSLEDMFPS